MSTVKKSGRAYSVFKLLDVQEEQRILTGIATTPTPDRSSDIVVPEGAQFQLPIPFLWQHDSKQPIGHVTQATVTSAGINVTVELAQISDPGRLKDRLDEAWQSIKIGLVRGLSIGFSSIEWNWIGDTYGMKFEKWEWVELSAVTIPANAEASIATVKHFDLRAPLSRQKRFGPVNIKPAVAGKSEHTGRRRGPVTLIKS